MSTINVFGATGFVGSHFCNKFKSDCLPQSREDNLPKTDNILYLISTTDNYNIHTDIHLDVDTNLSKLLSVLDNCRDKDITFNFVSSWFVYGKQDIMPVNENAICTPTGFYSITKKCAEDLLISFCKTYNKKYRILRLCNVIGPGDKGVSKKKNALQYLINEIKIGNPINLYNNGEFYRDYMYVDDVVEAIKLCIDKGPVNEIINIGSGNKMLFKDLIYFAVRKYNYKGIINVINPPDFHKAVQAADIYLDTTKLQNLGFKPRYNIYDILT